MKMLEIGLIVFDAEIDFRRFLTIPTLKNNLGKKKNMRTVKVVSSDSTLTEFHARFTKVPFDPFL